MNTLIAHFENIDAAREAIVELSAEGFERRRIFALPAGDALAATVHVTTEEDRLEEASDILTRRSPSDLKRARPRRH